LVVASAIGVLLVGDTINLLGYLAMILASISVLQLGRRRVRI
jgi:hypothetical protein